jgi:3,4-dihydroxy 2-butanone 4-phosphate synthase/GTP cyclohydrolase II
MEHYAITKGKFINNKTIKVRVISVNILNNLNYQNSNIFQKSLQHLSKSNNFALIIINNQNSSISTDNEIKSNNILRYYGIGAQIIKELKIKNMILVSRSKKKIIGLRGYGIKIKKQEIIK